jgi:phage terminase small subunit
MTAKKAPAAGLTPRQGRFVEEYLIDLNATQAAIRAGYAPKDADVQGPRLLGNVGVSRAIASAKAERSKRTEITQERVLRELALLAFSDQTHYQHDNLGNITLAPDAPEGAMRALAVVKRRITSIGGAEANGKSDGPAISTAEVEVRLWDKPGMLKLAGRHVGLFPDKIEVTGKDGKDLIPVARVDLRAALRSAVPPIAPKVDSKEE